jgi:hypothetical protein
MNRILLTVVFLAIALLHGQAQNGHFFLSHYNPGDEINYQSYDIHQDNHGVLYFANRSGILQFDGRTWTQISGNGAIYSLSRSDTGDLYAGGSAGFGVVTLNIANQTEYKSLSDSLRDSRNIFATAHLGNDVYFLNETRLFKISGNPMKATLLASSSATEGAYTGMYRVGNSIYVDTENEGLKKVTGNTLGPTDILAGRHLVLSEPSLDGKTYLLHTDDDEYYLMREQGRLMLIVPKDAEYLSQNVVVNAAWINDKSVAFGTLRGGVLFVDIESMATLETINYYTGLLDNEVYAIHTDRHLGVWISHEYGFTRAAPFLPFRTYNHYPGLTGNLLCAQSFKGTLYIGTSLGLFALTKQELYTTETYEVMQTIVEAAQKVQPQVTERKKARRGFLGLGKKKKEEPVATKPTKKTPPKRRHKVVQKERKVLRGVEHSFVQVLGVAGKVDQLIIVGDRLIGGGVSGVFEVKDLVGVPLTPEPTRAVYYSPALKQLLVGTYDNQIQSFRATSNGWEAGDFPDSLSMYADYFFEDTSENLWICGRDRVVRVTIEDQIILDAVHVSLPYTSLDKTVGLSYGTEVYITQNGEFFHYLGYKNQFVKYDSLPGPKKFFASSGAFWFFDGHRWRTIDRRNQGELKTEWLALFHDIRFLAPADLGKSLWVITGENELYKFSSEFAAATAESNPLFLKEVRNKASTLSPLSLRVDERESALTFEFIQPEYVSVQAVEYHYRVTGLQEGWSDWSSLNNVINFPFLPPGKYSVMVESRDLFGKITKLDTIEVNVVPPYWKRSWFYALEFILFATLVVLSMRLNVSTKRYRVLSQFLSALTIVLLIQVIQVVIVANVSVESTPVADFLMQVFIALLVLPVENFLRKRMTGASERTRR